jgi:hypothetical protein
MTKGQSIPLEHMGWIAIGAFAEAEPLVAAIGRLESHGVPLPDLCLVATPSSMARVAAAPELEGHEQLAALIHSAVELEASGSGGQIVASRSCVGTASSLLTTELADRLHGLIVDGLVLLGVPAASAGDAARAGQILLRNSSRHVHVLQCPPKASESK